jgi:hypothetical protein
MNFANWIGIVFLLVALAAMVMAAAASPAVRINLKRALAQPAFLIVTVALLTAALGLNASVSLMKLHFKKEPVPLARPLGAMPDKLGTWVQVSQDEPLDHEMQDVLGTAEYVFRDYINEREIPGVADRFKNKTTKERQEELSKIRRQYPLAVISLSVTYYTGMVDTVAHVPDRCVTADGYEPKSYETPKWPIARDLPAPMKQSLGNSNDVEVRFINFEDQTGAGNLNRAVSYFFHTNGKFISSPLGVRNELANLFVKKGYYAKVETMMAFDPKVSQASIEDMSRQTSDFLTAALPEIDKCMPDWQKVIAGDAPAKTEQQVASK